MEVLLRTDALTGAALLVALATAGAHGAEAPPSPWTGSVALVSDYRHRGISQSWREPALQGELQFGHPSGWYAGAWGSQVSPNLYPGARLEVDYYAGHTRTFAGGTGTGAGLLRYTHPGARDEPEPGTPAERFDGTVAFAELAWRAVDIRYWHGLSGGARGARYLDLQVALELGGGWSLGVHTGRQMLRDDPAYEYSDWRLGLERDFGPWTLGVAYSDTDADRMLYSVANASGTRERQLAGAAWIVWLMYSF